MTPLKNSLRCIALTAALGLIAPASPVAIGVLSAGGLITAVSTIIFVLEVWLTVDAPPPVEPVRRAVPLQMAPRDR